MPPIATINAGPIGAFRVPRFEKRGCGRCGRRSLRLPRPGFVTNITRNIIDVCTFQLQVSLGLYAHSRRRRCFDRGSSMIALGPRCRTNARRPGAADARDHQAAGDRAADSSQEFRARAAAGPCFGTQTRSAVGAGPGRALTAGEACADRSAASRVAGRSRLRQPQHDPEKRERFSEKIMLQQ